MITKEQAEAFIADLRALYKKHELALEVVYHSDPFDQAYDIHYLDLTVLTEKDLALLDGIAERYTY